MALRAFIYLRAYGLRLATGIYGVCTQVNGKRCPHYIIQIMQSLAEALRTPGTVLHNVALCKAREWRASRDCAAFQEEEREEASADK